MLRADAIKNVAQRAIRRPQIPQQIQQVPTILSEFAQLARTHTIKVSLTAVAGATALAVGAAVVVSTPPPPSSSANTNLAASPTQAEAVIVPFAELTEQRAVIVAPQAGSSIVGFSASDANLNAGLTSVLADELLDFELTDIGAFDLNLLADGFDLDYEADDSYEAYRALEYAYYYYLDDDYYGLPVEFEPIASETDIEPIAIDTDAVVELIGLLDAFLPLAETHELPLDASLLTDLQLQAERLGVRAPITVRLPGDEADLSLDTIYLADDVAAIVDGITGAASAWADTLAATPAIERSAAAGRSQFRYAPASRSAARSGVPTTVTEVQGLAQAIDTWIRDEEQAAYEAELQRIAELRARMVALSRSHGNGRLPAEALCTIPFSTRFTMRCDVIPSLVELNEAFRAHFGRDIQVNSGYRSGGNGRSNHGWGLAIDLGGGIQRFGTAEFRWMDANAPRFGWGHAFWARPGGINPEPWHWEAMDEIRELTGSWR